MPGRGSVGVGRNSEMRLERWDWIKLKKEVKSLGKSPGLRVWQKADFTGQAAVTGEGCQ